MSTNNEMPLYRLFLQPEDVKELKSDIWCDEPVAGSLRIDKKKFDIDIVYRGSHTRKFNKKSYYVSFYKPKTFLGAKEWHLNAEYRDPSLIRNKLSLDFFSSIGVCSPKSQHVFLVINGKQEGVYLQLESVDEQFIINRNKAAGSIFYAIDGDANFSLMSDLDKEVKKNLLLGYEQKCGNKEDRNVLEDFIYSINTLLPSEFEKKIEKYIDVDKYLAWLAGVVCTQNYDGFVHNYSLYVSGETGKIEIIPWDYDATWGRDVNGKAMDYDYVRIQGFNTLTARLLAVNSFRKSYKYLLTSILTNQFTPEFMEPKVNSLHEYIRPYLSKDPYKKDDISLFDQEPQFILKFIKDRREYLIQNMKLLD
ncbi:CotH kinase family protein [Rossellomorea aquimaris]|uniref:CotH kinase family protein n=1 Tax=Rossellomorea aquimaris TaxID=189382 RepID=UPI0007D0B58D|nr:CotH kinase family protein [Rossellomorea aquimaris]